MNQLTCIVCPKGCTLVVETDARGGITVTGNACPRGKVYAEKEATHPERMVTSSVRVRGGVRPLVPVKTQKPVLKHQIPETLQAIRSIHVEAPIHLGDVILPNIVATDSVDRA